MPRKNRTGRIPIKNITEPVKEEPEKQEIEEEKTLEPETQYSSDSQENLQKKPKNIEPEIKEKKTRVKKIKEPKKPRPYSFITAFSEWRKQNEWSGLCPKKGSDQYVEIRKIYDEKKKV